MIFKHYEEDWRRGHYDSFVKLESKLDFGEFLTSKWRFDYKSDPDTVPLLSVRPSRKGWFDIKYTLIWRC